MAEYVFIDGKFVQRDKAKVSVFDHCFLYGDGIFEGIRLYDGCVFRLDEHLERLFASAKYTMMKIPMDLEELKWATVEACRRNNLKDGYIRLVISRGEGDLGLAPWKCPIPSVIIIASKIVLYPAEMYKKGLKLATVATQRQPAAALNPRVKSCNYLNNILAKIEGQNAGVVEALMLNRDGYVVECTGDNIFIAKNDIIYTPPTYMGALEGITRNAIMEIAEQKGYEVREEPFTRFELFDADECFITGTAAEVVPVVDVDARPIGNAKPGKITKALNKEFRELVKRDGTCIGSNLKKPTGLAARWQKKRG